MENLSCVPIRRDNIFNLDFKTNLARRYGTKRLNGGIYVAKDRHVCIISPEI